MKFVAALGLACSLAISCQAADSLGTIRRSVTEVRFTVVATDRSGRPVLNLSSNEFSVMEDGRPISQFDLRPASDLSLQVGVLLDLSGSMSKSWPTMRPALIQALQQALRPEDQLTLLAFDHKIELQQEITAPQQLDTVNIPKGGGLTALYDAVYSACSDQSSATNKEPRRSALIIISDGEDNLSRHGLDDAIQNAEAASISVYSISVHNAKMHPEGDSVLGRLSGLTGGRHFIVSNRGDLQAAFDVIKEELRSSYLLYYRSPDATGRGKFRSVNFVPGESQGLVLRSRAGYYVAH